MKFTLSILLVLLLTSTAYPADVILSWTAPDDDRVTGYDVYYGTHNPPSSNEVTVEGIDTTSVELTVPDDQLIYFGAKSHDSEGNQSELSEVIYWHSEYRDKPFHLKLKRGGTGKLNIGPGTGQIQLKKAE